MADIAVPLITAGGTILAAVLTGFGAAALKHRWDVRAENARWDRERVERRREELRLALARYFETDRRITEMGYRVWRDRWSHHMTKGVDAGGRRKLVEQLERLEGTVALNPAQFSTMVAGGVAGDLLAMLLGPSAAQPFMDHVRELDDWVQEMIRRGERGEEALKPPDAVPLIQVANSLLGLIHSRGFTPS